MRTQRINFDEVSLGGTKSGKCACGKRRTRSQKFWQTINPFNKNADGTIKTREDILAKLRIEREEWRAKPITCEACQ